MLPNEIVLAPLPKLKIKYELSYQTTTRLKYIDKFDQLLIIQWREENSDLKESLETMKKRYGTYGRNVS
jgi:vacuolar-type H+-ATPase subunit B/Vma2